MFVFRAYTTFVDLTYVLPPSPILIRKLGEQGTQFLERLVRFQERESQRPLAVSPTISATSGSKAQNNNKGNALNENSKEAAAPSLHLEKPEPVNSVGDLFISTSPRIMHSSMSMLLMDGKDRADPASSSPLGLASSAFLSSVSTKYTSVRSVILQNGENFFFWLDQYFEKYEEEEGKKMTELAASMI